MCENNLHTSGQYRGVVFDLDGVIVSTDELHYQAWQTLAQREHIFFDRAINERLRGVSRMESLNILLEKAERNYTDRQKQEMADYKNEIYRSLLWKLGPEDILPGVRELLDTLEHLGIKIAIGSSSKNTPLILRQLGLENRFQAVADGNQIRNSKPDPEVFLLAARKLDIPARECVVVEDAEAGICAAVAAGARPVAVGSAQNCPGAAYSVPDLTHIQVEKMLDWPQEKKR